MSTKTHPDVLAHKAIRAYLALHRDDPRRGVAYQRILLHMTASYLLDYSEDDVALMDVESAADQWIERVRLRG